jgi:cytochrome c-type biogenesis protein CcmE
MSEPRRSNSKGKLVLVSVAVACVAIGTLVFSSFADAEFFKHVDEVTKSPDGWVDKNFKLHGYVEPGSIKESIVGQKTQRSFVLESQGQRMLVRSEGPKPDTFKDLAEVVATGRLTKEGDAYVFVASDLSAKCPSKYTEEQRSQRRPPPSAPQSQPSSASPSFP